MTKAEKPMVFTSWVVVEPAEDIPGGWVAHCLSFDVISQGSSPREALDAMAEALTMTVMDDPSERPAPAEDWERLADLLTRGKRVQMDEADAMASSIGGVVLAIELTLIIRRVSANASVAPSPFMPPLSQAVVDQPRAA